MKSFGFQISGWVSDFRKIFSGSLSSKVSVTLVRVPNQLPQEMSWGTNVFKRVIFLFRLAQLRIGYGWGSMATFELDVFLKDWSLDGAAKAICRIETKLYEFR